MESKSRSSALSVVCVTEVKSSAGIVGMTTKEIRTPVENLTWCLPRPRRNNPIPGCFPQHFEKKLMALLGWPKKILHPFGGRAEYGLRVDVRPEVFPDILGDAHSLPFKEGAFDCVLLDPPYNLDYSQRLYSTNNIHPVKAAQEAVRVCKEGGWVVWYHLVAMPVPPHTILTHRILLETRLYHAARIIHVHQKNTEAYHKRGIAMGLEQCSLCKAFYGS